MTAVASTLFVRLPSAVREHWRVSLLVSAMLALWLVTGVNLALQGSGPGLDVARARAAGAATEAPITAAAASTAATRLKAITPEDALAWNAAIPLSNLANPAAQPFRLNAASDADRLRSLDCLTAAIYYEAATEPVDGQRAVAQVVLNRVRHPAYPSTVCGVVFEGARRMTGCQFTFSCDGSLRRAPMTSYWERARQVAEAALAGYVYAPVGWATHYHTNWVVPYWASSLVKAANVGSHIFYRWSGGWGRPASFLKRYAGIEPSIQWRGGFGQPTMAERMAAAAADERDTLAAQAAAGAEPIGSVDSFQRAVLRRYEPLRRDTANAMIAERARADQGLTASQRWALTGSDTAAETPPQRPLGRWAAEPAEPAPLVETSAASPAPATPPAAAVAAPAGSGAAPSVTAR